MHTTTNNSNNNLCRAVDALDAYARTIHEHADSDTIPGWCERLHEIIARRTCLNANTSTQHVYEQLLQCQSSICRELCSSAPGSLSVSSPAWSEVYAWVSRHVEELMRALARNILQHGRSPAVADDPVSTTAPSSLSLRDDVVVSVEQIRCSTTCFSGVFAFDGASPLDHICRCGALLRDGWIVEISGEAGGGKTQVLLQALLLQAAQQHVCAAILSTYARMASENLIDGSSSSVLLMEHLRQRSCSCACILIASESVPSGRLFSIAEGARVRVMEAMRHKICTDTQLRPRVVDALMAEVEAASSAHEVLRHLLIKEIETLEELAALLRGPMMRAVVERSTSQRGLIAIDSIAAAASQTLFAAEDAAANATTTTTPSSQSPHQRMHRCLQDVHALLRGYSSRVCFVVANQMRQQVNMRNAIDADSSSSSSSAVSTRKRTRTTWPSDGSLAYTAVAALRSSPWAFTAHAHVRLEKLPTFGGGEDARVRRRAVLLRAPHAPPSFCVFTIGADGLSVESS